MTAQLDDLLKDLHSDGNRFDSKEPPVIDWWDLTLIPVAWWFLVLRIFSSIDVEGKRSLPPVIDWMENSDILRRIYTPGNTDVADRILAMCEDLSVIKKEVAFAEQAGDTVRFRDMARREIDHYIHDSYISLKDIVIGWQDQDLADYAIQMMTSKPEEDKLKYSLRYAAEIADAFRKKDAARQILERLLALQERDAENKFLAADTLKKLGRFDEAIDRYLECDGYGWLDNAMSLAREHSPNRVPEVAQRGFDSFDVKNGFAEFYVECARVLGRTNKAERTLVNYAERVEVESPPRIYSGVVKVLVSLEQKRVARQLVERVAQHEEEVKTRGGYYDEFERHEEMAQLYHAIGETKAVRDIYAERIETRISKGHNSSNVIEDINRAIELTGDITTFMEKKLLLHETQGDYKQASELAAELGKPKLAENYSAMHQMVQSVQARPGK